MISNGFSVKIKDCPLDTPHWIETTVMGLNETVGIIDRLRKSGYIMPNAWMVDVQIQVRQYVHAVKGDLGAEREAKQQVKPEDKP